MCILFICLYLKNYLSDSIFLQFVYNNVNDFETLLEENVFLELISVDPKSKSQILHIKHLLLEYILKSYLDKYNEVNDIYVEKIIESSRTDPIAEILKSENKTKTLIVIDCESIKTGADLITVIKKELAFPIHCGNNWDAINDFILEVSFPKKLCLKNWSALKKKLPNDAMILKEILNQLDKNAVLIEYN